MSNHVILKWKKGAKDNIEYVRILNLETLTTLDIVDKDKLEQKVDYADIKCFLNNKERYPYIVDNKEINKDVYVVLMKAIIEKDEIAYLLIDFNKKLSMVTGDDILNYKIANDINAIKFDEPVNKIVNNTMIAYKIENKTLELEHFAGKVIYDAERFQIETLIVNYESKDYQRLPRLENLQNLRKIIFNETFCVLSLKELQYLEELEFNKSFIIFNTNIKNLPRLNKIKVPDTKDWEYPVVFKNTKFYNRFNINYILGIKGNHYIDKSIFYMYDANGEDIIIPRNIIEIDIEAFNKVKRIKRVYLYGEDVKFRIDDNSTCDKFLDTGYPVELHISKYNTEKIPVGDNVTVIEDLGTEEDRVRALVLAKYRVLNKKVSVYDIINTYTDDDVKTIMDNLIDKECNDFKIYTHYSKKFKQAYRLKIFLHETSCKKVLKVLKNDNAVIVVYEDEFTIYPYCKERFIKKVFKSRGHFFVDDKYFNNNIINNYLEIEGCFRPISLYGTSIVNARIEDNSIKVDTKDGRVYVSEID